ncbi:(2R)-sulfolactate sulfo-lyase subunit beta [termite gut metagenome]|uniref:(2R)-sulfolactate sulfo-lyase subunit beta n=1 Tax=termite gut metagenome TaxID=433724 RepID=A0A5J4RN88_9ZZZZ
MIGYYRNNGRKGIRNIILVTYLVECAHHVAREIALAFPRNDVQLIGFGGCAPNDYAERIIRNLCTHPNVGGVLLVSLGCENFDREGLAKHIAESGRPVETIVIQENGGTSLSIQSGIQHIQTMLSLLEQVKKTDFDFSDLMVGTICGGSDATSGFTANPVIGKVFDQIIPQGAIGLFEEPGELLGCEQLMAQRAETPELGMTLIHAIHKADAYYKKMGHDSFSAGNAVGGLTTIEEKSLGSYSKSGSLSIKDLIKPGETPSLPGLYFLDVVPDGEASWGFPNINDNSEIMEMIATGCHLILFSTGRGSVVGSAISPVIKVCANPQIFQNLQDDMDINAGRIISEGVSLDSISDEIVLYIKNVIDGKESKSEALAHHEFSIGYKFFEYEKNNCK